MTGAVAPAMMDEAVWDDPPSLIDESELSTSALDSSHTSLVDEDDGEMELSSSLNQSAASVTDSDDDRTPLFPKSNSAVLSAADQPHLSHLTERQQLAYLMRTTQQQRRSRPAASVTKPQQQQSKRASSSTPPPAALPPQPPAKPNKPHQHNTTTTTANKPSILTHDKKRRRTITAANATHTTTTTSTIDPDDSHLYTVQRLPPAATAPVPLPTPPQYTSWSIDQQRRWDRISDQPGLYYYSYTAPGVQLRTGEWEAEEVELLLHLLVCHPVRGSGGRGGGSESEWGLFSMNVPGRVGGECERKWKDLSAAGQLLREDRFDYMQWHERQRQRTVDGVKAEADQPKRLEVAETAGGGKQAAVAAVAGAATVQAQRSSQPPVVVNRKRVGAPLVQPAATAVKNEVIAAAQTPVLNVEAATVKPEIAVVKAEPATVADKTETVTVKERVQRRERDGHEVREQPPRKKTVRFQPTPLQRVEEAATATEEPSSQALDDSLGSGGKAAPSLPAATVNRRLPPARVAIPLRRSAPVDENSSSALWPPRPPRTQIAASLVPSTITPPSTSAHTIRRLDTAQLTTGELHMLRAQATYEVQTARLQSLLQAELARLQPDSSLPADHSSIGCFRPNAARLSKRYFCQQSQPVEESVAVEQNKLVKALHGRIAWMQADVEREYRLQCDMLTAMPAGDKRR